MDIVKEINAEQKITLVVSQQLIDVALTYGSRLIGLQCGRIIFDGLPQELIKAMIQQIYGEMEADANLMKRKRPVLRIVCLVLGGIDHSPGRGHRGHGRHSAANPALRCHPSDHPAVHHLHSLSFGHQHLGGYDPRFRWDWWHRILYSSLAAPRSMPFRSQCRPDRPRHAPAVETPLRCPPTPRGQRPPPG
jgi:hypothetical protein